jgi:tetratricopeptide (TPR) repeat protein
LNATDDISELMQDGFSLLDRQRYREAIKVGRKLKRLKHSSAFEIMGLAYLHLDRLPEAITVLEEGVAKAGSVWLLWELLGNCHSYSGNLEKAEAAYGRAIELDGCNRDLIHLNRGIAFNRAGRNKEALEALRRVRSGQLGRRAGASRIRANLELGKTRSARSLALRLSRLRPHAEERYGRPEESEICLACALALKGSSKSQRLALRLAHRAVQHLPTNTNALALIRSINGKPPDQMRLFRLLIQGPWPASAQEPDKSLAFFRTIEVAAKDPAAALRLAKPFFPPAIRRALTVEESSSSDAAGCDLEGIYFLSGYLLYPETNAQ